MTIDAIVHDQSARIAAPKREFLNRETKNAGSTSLGSRGERLEPPLMIGYNYGINEQGATHHDNLCCSCNRSLDAW